MYGVQCLSVCRVEVKRLFSRKLNLLKDTMEKLWLVKSQKNDVLICGCLYDIIKKRKDKERTQDIDLQLGKIVTCRKEGGEIKKERKS